MSAPLAVQAIVPSPIVMTVANTDRDFSSGTVYDIIAGTSGGKMQVLGVLVTLPDAVSAATEIGFAYWNGSIYIPLGVQPVGVFTPTVGQPFWTAFFAFPMGKISLPTTSDIIRGRVHTGITAYALAMGPTF